MPPQLREARFLPATYDEKNRVIEVMWSTGAKVRRYDFWNDELYDEELDMSAEACDMSRLASGAAAVLDSHSRWSLSSQIGVVDKAWLVDGEGRALIRFSEREELAGLIADIRSGVIQNISVGYTVQRYQIERAAGQVPVYRAVEWQPYEISFVPVPAEAGAGTRNAPVSQQGSPCVFSRADAHQQELSMPNRENVADATRAAAAAAESTPNCSSTAAGGAATAEAGATGDGGAVAVAAETARAAEIAELANRHGCQDRAAEWLRSGRSVDDVRGLILTEIATRDAASGGHINRVSVTVDEVEKCRGAAVAMILHRAQVIDPATRARFTMEHGNPFRGFTLVDVARSCLERAGVRTQGMSKLELVGRAFTQSTSDFPILLEAAMHKALQAGYAVAPDTWTKWCKQGTGTDFRAHNRYRVGSLGNFDALNELGEFKNKSIPDGEKASITAATKGNIINISRQAIINDDLDAFVGLATMLGRAGKRTVEADAYAYLASNPTLSDGVALFHADHGNLASAAAPSVTTVDEGRVLLAKQTDVGGNDYLDLRPAVWLGPLTYDGTARVINNSEFDPDTSNKLQKPNMVRGVVREVVGTPRITDTKWYLFADPNEAPVIEVAFLDGNSEPFLDMEEGFSVDGARFKGRLDFGIAAIDYRGAMRNG
jgi:hypothetical protein